MSLHVVVRVASVLLGTIGACCLAVAAVLGFMWLMDQSDYSGFDTGVLWGVAALAALGAVFVWLARALPRLVKIARARA